MAITHSTAARNAAADAVCNLVDAGAGPGLLVYRTAVDAEVATCTFSATAFGAPANGVKTANPITDDPAATGGTATICTIEDSNSVEVWRGTVTSAGGGGDIELSNNVVQANDIVSTTSATYTAPV